MKRQFQTSASSRERNRIHARRTRQRKKMQMESLNQRAEELKNEQIRLKQDINEKNTASILVGLFASDTSGDRQHGEDPKIEALLRRPSSDIPDVAKLPELPALILPGQHNSKKHKESSDDWKQDLPDDGIDYDLLRKDRSKCSSGELDKIRRERNRMHAKRTRDRKRLFVEEMTELCKNLEDENKLLSDHLGMLHGKAEHSTIISPSLSSSHPEETPTELTMPMIRAERAPSLQENKVQSQSGVSFDQIKTLLEAASTFSSTVSESSSPSDAASDSSQGEASAKRRRLGTDHQEKSSEHIPSAITTGPATSVGC